MAVNMSQESPYPLLLLLKKEREREREREREGERERERGEREKHTEKEREQNAFGGQDERFSPKEMSMFQRFIATKNQTVSVNFSHKSRFS